MVFPHKILELVNKVLCFVKIRKVKKSIIHVQSKLGDVLQVYAVNDSSICIRKNNLIVIWGSPENGIFGKDKMTKEIDSKNKKNFEFVAKPDFSEIIKTTIIKENLDFTEEYINSRKLFNTKYNQIKRDNMIKKIIIKKLEEKKNQCIEEAQKNVSKNVFI